MVVLIVFALLWLGVRVAVTLQLAILSPTDQWPSTAEPTPLAGRRQSMDAPQDAPVEPPADAVEVAPPFALAAGLCRQVTKAVCELASGRWMAAAAAPRDDFVANSGEPGRDWPAALRETISAAVVRPEAGPACLGGREDAAYLRGWDDAVDWISQGQDARPPTWAGVAYMTGWNDGFRDVARARRRATRWPSPATGCSL